MQTIKIAALIKTLDGVKARGGMFDNKLAFFTAQLFKPKENNFLLRFLNDVFDVQ